MQCNLYHWGMLKSQKICRFTFNTSFISSNELVFTKKELDPDNFIHNHNVSDNFEIILKFNKVCYCEAQMDFSERCVFCKRYVNPEEQEKWVVIKDLLKERLELNSSIILFYNPENDDIAQVLTQDVTDDE